LRFKNSSASQARVSGWPKPSLAITSQLAPTGLDGQSTKPHTLRFGVPDCFDTDRRGRNVNRLSTAWLSTGMHGMEHCEQKRRTFRLSAPQWLFSPAAGSMLPGSPLAASCPEPVARNRLSRSGRARGAEGCEIRGNSKIHRRQGRKVQQPGRPGDASRGVTGAMRFRGNSGLHHWKR
jgi:hypothetical protein